MAVVGSRRSCDCDCFCYFLVLLLLYYNFTKHRWEYQSFAIIGCPVCSSCGKTQATQKKKINLTATQKVKLSRDVEPSRDQNNHFVILVIPTADIKHESWDLSIKQTRSSRPEQVDQINQTKQRSSHQGIIPVIPKVKNWIQ